MWVRGAGRVSHSTGTPHIGSIVRSGSGQSLTLTITGSGFGDAPPQVGQNTDGPFFVFTDYNATSAGHRRLPLERGLLRRQ